MTHMGSKKLRNLHTITTLEKPIKIIFYIYKICELTKIKQFINRRLIDYKDKLLNFINIDIYGSFPKLVKSNRYFFEIINNYSKRIWSYLYINRKNIIRLFQYWKIESEF